MSSRESQSPESVVKEIRRKTRREMGVILNDKRLLSFIHRHKPDNRGPHTLRPDSGQAEKQLEGTPVCGTEPRDEMDIE